MPSERKPNTRTPPKVPDLQFRGPSCNPDAAWMDRVVLEPHPTDEALAILEAWRCRLPVRVIPSAALRRAA